LLKSGRAQEELDETINQIHRWDSVSGVRTNTLYTALLRLGHIIFIDSADEYRQSSKFEDAEVEIRREIRDTVSYARKGSKIATILIENLSVLLHAQGRWKEAEELDVQVTETKNRVLGAEHPDTLTSMAYLALTYRNQGRWKEAEELEVQVMEMTKRVLGEEHPFTLIIMANLASTYRNQGRWKEAEELEVQVIETTKRVLGEEHPFTLTSINNLAFTWKGQGRGAEALKLIEKCVQLRTLVLGADHPDTLSSSVALIGWQTKRLEIDASAAKGPGNSNIVSQTD
jgi:tetratricopeptide (TPR) repeat protein